MEKHGKEAKAMNGKVIKVVGIAANVLGIVCGLVTNYVSKQERDDKIAEEVSKAVAEAMNNNNGES